jgi:O-antigen ligase
MMVATTASGTDPAAPTVGGYAAVLAGALLAGVLFAHRPMWAVAALAATAFVLVTFRAFVAGLALWVPSFFVAGSTPGKALLMAGFVVCSLAWVIDLLRRRPAVAVRLSRFQLLLLPVPVMVAWFALSLSWAHSPAAGFDEMWRWVLAIEIFLIVLTAPVRMADVLLLTAAWVAGATVAAFTALLSFPGGDVADSDADSLSRLAGSAGDPNFLASRLIAGMLLAFGLLRVLRHRGLRGAVLCTLPVLGAATAGTGSRGGLVAIGLAAVVALVVFRRHAHLLLWPALAAVVSAGLWFVLFPQYWTRILSFGDGGSGRTDLWKVAVRLSVQNPVGGVGLGNFGPREAALALDVGPVLDARAIAEDRREAHNTYLQLWSDTGTVGLLLFLGIVGACVWCALRAATLFDRAGRGGHGDLARMLVVAIASYLGSSAFISAGRAHEFWALFALGPVLLALAGPPPDTAEPDTAEPDTAEPDTAEAVP